MASVARITPCLWFDGQAEDAARFYTSIFADSRITKVSRYGEAGREVHGQAAGTVMVVAFELNGQPFTALNGGPHSGSTKPSLCRSVATTRRKWTTTGKS